jgi:hypothetical protein
MSDNRNSRQQPDPVHVTDQGVINMLARVIVAIQALGTTVANQQSALQSISKKVAADREDDSQQTPAVRVGAFELKGIYRYSSGGEYRVWRIMQDVPAIDVTGGWKGVTGPAHATIGDELHEDADDGDEDQFVLKRQGRTVAYPEHWSVAEAFGGSLPPWNLQQTADHPVQHSPSDGPIAMLIDPPDEYYVARTDVRRTRIRRGDVLTFGRPEVAPGCMIVPLTIADYEALRSVEDRLDDLFDTADGESVFFLRKYMHDRKRWRLRSRIWAPQWFITRRAEREVVTASLSAHDDDSALHALLTAVGCTLPDARAR